MDRRDILKMTQSETSVYFQPDIRIFLVYKRRKINNTTVTNKICLINNALKRVQSERLDYFGMAQTRDAQTSMQVEGTWSIYCMIIIDQSYNYHQVKVVI